MKYILWSGIVIVGLSIALVCIALFGGILFLTATLILFSLAFAMFLVMIGVSVLYGAPYLPTVMRTVREMILFADIKQGERFVDIGSGDGRLVIAAARAGAFAVGYEVNPYLWAYSWMKILQAGQLGRAKVYLNCFWGKKFCEYDVVTVFFIKNLMPRLEKKLRAELRPGARVISAIFQFPSWSIEKQNNRGVYCYRQSVE